MATDDQPAREAPRLGGRPSLLALPAAIASLVALAGGVCLWAPSLDPFVDLAAQFAVAWLALALGGALLGLLTRRRGGRVGLAFGLLAMALLVPALLIGLRPYIEPAQSDRPVLRLVQYNTWFQNVDPARSAAVVLAAKPDIVVLEEVTARGESVTGLLRGALPYAVDADSGPGQRGVVVLSRRPLAQVSRRPRGAPLSVWARGLAPDGGPVEVIGAHFGWPEPFWPQRRQQEALAGWAAGAAAPDLIVAGDFNASPWSRALRRADRLLADAGLSRRTSGQLTWPARTRRLGALAAPVLAIDQVYAGRSWRTVEVRRLSRTGSDHYPVLVVLQRR